MCGELFARPAPDPDRKPNTPMNVLRGYEHDPITGRIYSIQNRRNRRWCQQNRNRTSEWNAKLHEYREHKKRCGSLEDVKMRRRREMLYRARWRAKQQDLACDIKLEHIVIPAVCPISKRRFRFREGRAHPDSPSLDRINPKRGYVRGNIRVICWLENNRKRDAGAQTILRLAQYVLTDMPPIALRRLLAKL